MCRAKPMVRKKEKTHQKDHPHVSGPLFVLYNTFTMGENGKMKYIA